MTEPRHVASAPLVVIGIGNEYRCDDGVGVMVARRLQARNLPGVRIIEANGAALLEAWQQAETVILLDAVQSGAAAGTIHRLEAQAQPLPVQFFRASTHAFGVAEAIKLARALQQLPPRLLLFGIEGKCFAAGTELSAEVAAAVPTVVQRVLEEIARHREGG
jgi:hydrogenase maturation protease